MKQITIVGAGLTGALLALYLARRGYDVTVYEKNSDPRLQKTGQGRSINLALSVRGLNALAEVGLDKTVLEHAIKMPGRQVHPLNQKSFFQLYGASRKQCNYALSRLTLNQLLLNETAKHKNISCYFETHVRGYDANTHALKINQLGFLHDQPLGDDILFAADGVNSPIRKSLEKVGAVKVKHTPLAHGYKELTMPASKAKDLEQEALHIWPRDDYMLIALPNTDGSMTCTLFLAQTGEVSFESLNTPDKVRTFFEAQFPDVVPRIPDLVETFFNHPTGHLASSTCHPWRHKSRVCLIGDSAHAMVPFYGQGMNCAFEDVTVLDGLIESLNGRWREILPAFEQARTRDAEAITQMSFDNYQEMRETVSDKRFQFSKAIERHLMKTYPDTYTSQYSMIAFDTVPYTYAQACGDVQKALLDELVTVIPHLKDIQGYTYDKPLKQYVKKIKSIEKEFA